MDDEPFPRAPEPTAEEERAHHLRRQRLLAKRYGPFSASDVPILGELPTLSQLFGLRR